MSSTFKVKDKYGKIFEFDSTELDQLYYTVGPIDSLMTEEEMYNMLSVGYSVEFNDGSIVTRVFNNWLDEDSDIDAWGYESPSSYKSEEPKCPHEKKYVNVANQIKFWYCPDCKKDLGDV